MRPRELHIIATVLLLLSDAQRAAAWQREVLWIPRNTTCLEDKMQTFGFSSDLCKSGDNFKRLLLQTTITGVSSQNNKAKAPHFVKFLGQEAALARTQALYTDLIERCTSDPGPGLAQIECASAEEFYQPWLSGMCENQRRGKPYTTVLAHGCSKTCRCCGGGHCNEVLVMWPDTLPVGVDSDVDGDGDDGDKGEDSDEAESSEEIILDELLDSPVAEDGATERRCDDDDDDSDTEPLLPLLLYLHPYSGDSSWAHVRQNLDELVDKQRFIVVAPNGRQDDLGLPGWLASDDFNGNFQYVLNSGNVEARDVIESADAATERTPDELELLATSNPDINYIEHVLNYTMKRYRVDPTRVYVMGKFMGGDMATLLACQLADRITAIISFEGYGYTRDTAIDEYCRPTHPVHVLHVYNETYDELKTKTKLDDIQADTDFYINFWARHNNCSSFSIPESASNLGGRLGGNWGNETKVYVIDDARCSFGGSVTYWRTTDNTNPDPGELNEALWMWLESRSMRDGPPDVDSDDFIPGEMTEDEHSSTEGLGWYKVFIGFILCLFLATGVVICIRYSLCLNTNGESVYTNVLNMTLEQYKRENYGTTYHEIEAALQEPRPGEPGRRPLRESEGGLTGTEHKSTASNLHTGIQS